jgi:hypothetical protein
MIKARREECMKKKFVGVEVLTAVVNKGYTAM